MSIARLRNNGYVSRLLDRGITLSACLTFCIALVTAARAQSGAIPIEHFIFIVQENHSFDNYFGTYPGANGIPKGAALAGLPWRSARPTSFPRYQNPRHQRPATRLFNQQSRVE